MLIRLNDRLAGIESDIKKECQTLIDQLEKRKSDCNDWLEWYEIECCISYHLREDDPGYDEDSDKMLIEMRESISEGCWGLGMGDGKNHSKYRHTDFAIKDDPHCWLFNCLSDRTDLGWINILRIGNMWIDIKVICQKSVTL